MNGEAVIIGSRTYMEEQSVDCSDVGATSSIAGTHVYIGVNGRLAGFFALEESAKPSARDALAALRAMKYRIILLSGDRDEAANRFARDLGIDHVEGQMLPADKAAFVSKLEAEGSAAVCRRR